MLFASSLSDWNFTGFPPRVVRMGPSIPCPFIVAMKSAGLPNGGAPIVSALAIVTAVMKSCICAGSVHTSACGAPAQTEAQRDVALAEFTLMVPWLQTVTRRFLGLVGSGSTNVAQKSS